MSDIEDDPLNPRNEYRQAEAAQAVQTRQEAALERLRAKQDSFRRIFSVDGAQAALADLKEFCRGDQTAWADDPRYHALLCGRQEVWIRLQDYLKLSFEELVDRRS